MRPLFTSRATAIAAAAVAGVMVGLAAVPLLGYALAVVLPQSFIGPFRGAGALGLGLFLWDLIIYFVPGPGFLALGALLLLFRYTRQSRVLVVASFMASVLVAMYVLVPALYGQALGPALNRPWYGYSFEVMLLVAALLATALSKRFFAARQVSSA